MGLASPSHMSTSASGNDYGDKMSGIKRAVELGGGPWDMLSNASNGSAQGRAEAELTKPRG
jgi:hypothetical protein